MAFFLHYLSQSLTGINDVTTAEDPSEDADLSHVRLLAIFYHRF